jgi:hypothetical protein
MIRMTLLIQGNGLFDFRIDKGRIEYETIANIVGDVPAEGLKMDCVAVIVLDDQAVHAWGYGVAAGVIMKGTNPVNAGWLSSSWSRRYRDQLDALMLDKDEGIICCAKLIGGAEIEYKKGPQRLSFNLHLDLAWPISVTDQWYDVCAPYLRLAGKLG